MDWREKLVWGGLFLVLISWGLELFAVWSVLTAHLTWSNWMMIVLIHPAVLLTLIGAYFNTPKGTTARVQVLTAAVFVIISWSQNFALMGKIGGR